MGRLPFRVIGVLAGTVMLLSSCGGGTPSAATTTTPPPPGVRPLAVIDTATEVAHTAAGAVGYRQIGTGSPILLLMGLGGSLDDWQPSFVAALASGHRVVMLDNAGVGQTAALGSPLSITEMADQTSALISTLRLGRVAVLGWSM